MFFARTAVKQPRVFILGLVLGVVLVGSGFLLATLATSRVGAQSGGGTVPACVSIYTGQVRLGYPGQLLTCSQGEYPLELNAGSPAASLSYALRTVEDDVSEYTFFASYRSVDCLAGETAVSGGSRLMRDGIYINSSTFETNADGPVGSPPSGWQSGFEYSASFERPNTIVETWVLCVS